MRCAETLNHVEATLLLFRKINFLELLQSIRRQQTDLRQFSSRHLERLKIEAQHHIIMGIQMQKEAPKKISTTLRKSETQRILEKGGKLGEIKIRGAPERNESIDDQQVISHVLALISPKIRLQNTAKNLGRKFQKVAQNYRIKKMKKQSRYN